MENLQKHLDSLQSNLHTMVEQRAVTEKNVKRLEQNLKQSQDKEAAYIEEIQLLKEENKKLKVVNAISGNDEYKRLMKIQLNKLIKEIDLCIIELKAN